MKTKLITLLIVAAGISSLTSCLPLAAGAAVGYVAHEEGYRVHSPISRHWTWCPKSVATPKVARRQPHGFFAWLSARYAPSW